MPLTEQQILEAEGDVLSGLLGEVFDDRYCGNCVTNPGKSLKVPDCEYKRRCYRPIPLNWDNAGKWWKWAIDTHGCEAFERVVAKLDASKRRYPFDPNDSATLAAAISNIMLQCDPKDFLLIAALCELGAKP